MADPWLSLPGTGDCGNCTSDSSYGTVLYGNVILFCKKFGETGYLVYGNRFILEASGQLCAEKSHDYGNEASHYGNCNCDHGDWISLHEECTCWKDLPDCSMGLPCVILFPESENRKNGKETLAV